VPDPTLLDRPSTPVRAFAPAGPVAPMPSHVRRLLLVMALGAVLVLAGGCSAFTPQSPPATPTDFAGVVSELALAGVSVTNVVEGDPGCTDQRLARTAISFSASGVDQATPTRVYLYAFKNPTVFDELRPMVDLCARSYVKIPSDYASVDATPYTFAGPGPWTQQFAGALRQALQRIAVGG
jgi:hypothetical protein